MSQQGLDWFMGFLRPTPATAGPAARAGVGIWRVSVFVVPLLCVVAAWQAQRVSEDLRAAGDELLHPMTILFTVGLVLILVFILYVAAAVAQALSVVALVAALPLALLTNWGLGRLLDPEEPRSTGAFTALAIVGTLGVLAAPLHWNIFPPLALVSCLPLLGFVLALSGRETLKPAAPGARRLPVAGAAPPPPPPGYAHRAFCTACGTSLGGAPVAACARCGAPVGPLHPKRP